MDLGLAGRRAMVAGASSGLGLSCVRALVAEGVSVVMASRSADNIEAAAAGIDPPSGVRVIPLVADVSDPEDAEGLVADTIEALGGVDIAIANAGGPRHGGFDDVGLDDYYRAIDLNMMSSVALVRAAVADMRPRGWGRIVAITSATVREPRPDLILSNTARAATTAFLKTTATAVAGDGITVNSLQPGLHLTPRLADLGDRLEVLAAGIPVGRIGNPDDFGRMAAVLCSDWAGFITGAAIPIDGGALSGLQ